MSHETVPVTDWETVHEYLTIRRVRERQDLQRVIPVGEIDLCTAPILREALADADVVPNLVVDLSQVDFLALIGVQVLQAARTRRTTANQRLVLTAPTAAAQRVLSLTDAAAELEIYLSTRSALSALSPVRS
ncbi:anti-anti-sigma factor [Actinophytocola oryzae]|uniref:Anti-anti-sigma factor n=2 Tax=Actinophytocola oryzae TaxID=502181 RepID=A0A4R7VY91_9PSEU|nr:anti-anti-sigma factor [Actinophytocola oryzae]